jgi:hypothetical protein
VETVTSLHILGFITLIHLVRTTGLQSASGTLG